MKYIRTLAVVLFLSFSLVLSGCSDTDGEASVMDSDTEQEVMEESDVDVVEESDDGVGSDTAVMEDSGDEVSDVDSAAIARKEALREKIRVDREKADKGSDSDDQKPVALASTGSATNALLSGAAFLALIYVGVRRKFAVKKGEVDIL